MGKGDGRGEPGRAGQADQWLGEHGGGRGCGEQQAGVVAVAGAARALPAGPGPPAGARRRGRIRRPGGGPAPRTPRPRWRVRGPGGAERLDQQPSRRPVARPCRLGRAPPPRPGHSPVGRRRRRLGRARPPGAARRRLGHRPGAHRCVRRELRRTHHRPGRHPRQAGRPAPAGAGTGQPPRGPDRDDGGRSRRRHCRGMFRQHRRRPLGGIVGRISQSWARRRWSRSRPWVRSAVHRPFHVGAEGGCVVDEVPAVAAVEPATCPDAGVVGGELVHAPEHACCVTIAASSQAPAWT